MTTRVVLLFVVLVIVPFWTNALIRIYGWRILLMGNGPINSRGLSDIRGAKKPHGELTFCLL